jgi:hypothetical protein
MPKKTILGKLVGIFFFSSDPKASFEYKNIDKICILCPYFHVQNVVSLLVERKKYLQVFPK